MKSGMIRPPRNLDPTRESKTMELLRKRMKEVRTLAQFEGMALRASQPAAFRRLCAPMLPPDLPCCGPGALNLANHNQALPHMRLCPTRNQVTLH